MTPEDDIANKKEGSSNMPPDAIPKDLLQKMLADIKADAAADTKKQGDVINEIRESHKTEHALHDEFHKNEHQEVSRRLVNLNNSEQKLADLVTTFATREYVDAKLEGLASRLEVTASTLTKERESTAKTLSEQVVSSATALSNRVDAAAKEMDTRVQKTEDKVSDIEKTGSANSGSKIGSKDTLAYLLMAMSGLLMLANIFDLFK